MPDPRISAFHQESQKIVSFLHAEFGRLQTGRASVTLVEHIEVEAYGQRMPMKAVGGISIQDARSIVIQPWDKSVLQAIEKAIHQSNIGVNPINDGVVIRINLPPMTQERRAELSKVVQKLAEEARISARQARQKVHDGLKEEKNETLKHSLEAELQKHVDSLNEQIDEMRKKKEEELMKI